jgi:hypothetical protein
VDVRELTITGTGVAPYPSGTRIVPTSPISIGVGERHDLAARPW